MKNLILGIILLFLFSCSSNPEKTIERNSEELLIEKPLINYKLNSLPKDINVIFFSNPKTQKPLGKAKLVSDEEKRKFIVKLKQISDKYEGLTPEDFLSVMIKENSLDLSLIHI